MSDLLLAVRNLSLDLSDPAAGPRLGRPARRRVLEEVNIDLPRGAVLGVLGQAGAGKSVLGRTLLRLHEPDTGTIVFDGQDITRAGRPAMDTFRARSQMVFAAPRRALNPRQTGRALIAAPLLRRLARDDALARADAAIAAVGLPRALGDRYPHQMADAEVARIAIARAIAPRPAFVVADAVGDGLDLSARAETLALLEDLQRDLGLTMVVLSRDPSVIRHLSDQTIVLKAGRIVETAPTPALFARPAHPHTRAMIAAAPLPVADQIW